VAGLAVDDVTVTLAMPALFVAVDDTMVPAVDVNETVLATCATPLTR